VKPPLFFSTFMYSACKVVGAERWPERLAYEMAHLDESPWPGFRTMGQADKVAEAAGVELRTFVDGSTYITRARCVAAGHFLYKSGADSDVWLTADDDVYADARVLESLLLAARATRGLVALPYLNRDGHSMTFRRVTGPTLWLPGKIPVRAVDRIGMGLVAMHRSFVEVLARRAPMFEHRYPAIFLEGITEVDRATGIGVWTGEDYWLCGLAEAADLPMHVLLDAPGWHAGHGAKLDLDGQICVETDADRQKLETARR
jgi:hypothetical protein